MTSTGLVESWRDTPPDWGPLYPFVGYESAMLASCVLFCIAFLFWKFRDERIRYDREVRDLESAQQRAGEG